MTWFLELVILFVSNSIAQQTNVDIIEAANTYLNGANSFYSGHNKHEFFHHLSDDFEWIVGPKIAGSSKQAFIDFNNPFFGAVDNVFGHHEIISYKNPRKPDEKAFVIAKLSTFVQQKKCKEWFENIDIFIFNEKKQIKTAFAVFIDEQEYTAKQIKVNHPNCTTDQSSTSNDNEMHEIKQILDNFVLNQINNNDENLNIMADDYELIGYPLYQRCNVNQINDINFKQYGIGHGIISGFIYIHIQNNKCQTILRDFIVLYINKNNQIYRHIQLPIDSHPDSSTFNHCLQTLQHEEL